MARKNPLSSRAFIWLFLLALVPGGAFAGDCDNAANYDLAVRQYGGSGGFAAACKALLQGIKSTQQKLRAELKRVGAPVPGELGESQAGAFHATAGMQAQGSAAEGERKRIAEEGITKFTGLSKRAQEMKVRLGQEATKAAASTPAGQRDRIQMLHNSASMDFTNLDAVAQAGAAEAKRGAKSFGRSQAGFAAGAVRDEATAQGFRGRDFSAVQPGSAPPAAAAPPVAPPPAAPEGGGVSANTLVAVGGAGLVVAGAVGGLYWVSQRAISKANGDIRDRLNQADYIAAARIQQADQAADARIKQADGAANKMIERAERILQLAVGSANQIIANAQSAAIRIYEMAKKDITNLLTTMRAQMIADFRLLTTEGLQKMMKELSDLLDGLIRRAQAEGNAELASSLTQLKASLLSDIQQEIARRAAAGGSATATATATSTSTATNTATN